MQTSSFLAMIAVLVVAACLGFGCGSNNQQPSDSQSATSGGNGTMGESPAHPGSYGGDRYNAPPATQPSGS